jgi:DNA-binding transcriptional ArsR family regulator
VDKPPSKSTSRAIRSLFSGRRAHVLHGLLMRREDWLGVTELAEDVSASPSTVSMVLTELERLDWLDSRGQGPGKQRRVSQPAALLDAWATSLRQQPAEAMRRFFVPGVKVDALAAGLEGVCSSHGIGYAVTPEAAAQRYALLSNVSQVRIRLPVGSTAEAALGELGARPVSEGANLVVIDAKSPGDLLFRQRVDAVWLGQPDPDLSGPGARRGARQGIGRAPAPDKDRLLMVKPSHFGGYSDAYTVDCERVLVTLLRGLGPWKESVFLVGGLTPRYLVPQRPPDVPAHAGTLDVDIVIDLQLLADTDAYHSLEDNLKRMGFERAVNEQGLKLSWRWQTRTEHGALMVLELLADAPQIAGGRVQPLPTEGTISALDIPHSSIVSTCIRSPRSARSCSGENGIATERVKHADIVSFTCLKAFAFDQRFERKDARRPGLLHRACPRRARRRRRRLWPCAGRHAFGGHQRRTRCLGADSRNDEADGLPQGRAGLRSPSSSLVKGRSLNSARPGCSGSARPVISSTGCSPTSGSGYVDRVPVHARCPTGARSELRACRPRCPQSFGE